MSKNSTYDLTSPNKSLVLKPKAETLAVKLLSWAVRTGVVRRGYGWALAHLPALLWGGKLIRTSTLQGPFVVPLDDPASTPYLLWGYIPHEVHESRLFEILSPRCRIMLDVGAHVGYYARLVWSRLQRGGQVHAFEPNPDVFPFLWENTRNCPGLYAHPLAVGEIAGKAMFFRARSSNLGSMSRPVGHPTEVNVTTLDAFCESKGLNGRVDLVKCDVEGGELSVLKGARKLRSADFPPIWMVEVDRSFLREANVSAEELNTELLGRGKPSQLYYLNRSGEPIAISNVLESKAPNIFVVSEQRIGEFLQAAERAYA